VVGADVAAGAGAVLDDHRLANLLAQLVGEQPRHDVGGAARGERRNEADRLGRVGLGVRGAAQRERASKQERFHGRLFTR
jgi:hypothetical protein